MLRTIIRRITAFHRRQAVKKAHLSRADQQDIAAWHFFNLAKISRMGKRGHNFEWHLSAESGYRSSSAGQSLCGRMGCDGGADSARQPSMAVTRPGAESTSIGCLRARSG